MTGRLEVTVAGSSPAIPRAGRCCSAYLLRGGGVSIALDFGTGAYSNLRGLLFPDALDAIVVTHMHADHFIDLIPLRYALKYGARTVARKMPLYLPPGGEAMLRKLTSAFAHEPAGDFLSEVYDIHTYDPATSLAFGSGIMRFAPSRHYIPTFAVRYDVGEASITYSSDTAPCESVVALARETSLFICEATLLPDAIPHGVRGHCTAAEAGTMATDAAVRRLVLSHWPAETSAEELERFASATYAGPIAIADDLARFEL